MLHQFVTEHREEIITRCRAKVATRSVPPPTQGEIDHGVPMFLDQLVDELRLGSGPNPDINRTATLHGHDLLHQGFTVSQVVHDYGDVCQSITELAMDLNASISSDDFRMLNRCLDDAIAAAVTQYGLERDESIDGKAADQNERRAVLVRGLRASIHRAGAALEAIKSGNVGISGSTGTVLDVSLSSAHDLVDLLLDQLSTPGRPLPVLKQS